MLFRIEYKEPCDSFTAPFRVSIIHASEIVYARRLFRADHPNAERALAESRKPHPSNGTDIVTYDIV